MASSDMSMGKRATKLYIFMIDNAFKSILTVQVLYDAPERVSMSSD